MLETLRAIDLAVLTDVVRQDQRSPTFEILDWSVKRLSDKGVINPDGLFLFSGQGRDGQGTRPWSVVLKILKKPDEEQDIREIFYWKRELLAVQSGLLSNLPDAVVRPRFYGVIEQEDSGWIWMENIVESKPHWTIDQFTFSARKIGRFSGACLTLNPLPDFPWLCTDYYSPWLKIFPTPEFAWDNPFVRKFFSSRTHERVLKLWNERPRFYDALNRLPQVFSHFDFKRGNLFIRQQDDGQDELVAIDWALCGYAALGAELCSMIGFNAMFFSVDVAALPKLETATFEAYIDGLREAGWQGNPDHVRLGYTATQALLVSVGSPRITAVMLAENSLQRAQQLLEHTPDEMAGCWSLLCEFALDNADEARRLMDKLT
jgi:hypothetical protein